jgi:hypothetical protein
MWFSSPFPMVLCSFAIQLLIAKFKLFLTVLPILLEDDKFAFLIYGWNLIEPFSLVLLLNAFVHLRPWRFISDLMQTLWQKLTMLDLTTLFRRSVWNIYILHFNCGYAIFFFFFCVDRTFNSISLITGCLLLLMNPQDVKIFNIFFVIAPTKSLAFNYWIEDQKGDKQQNFFLPMWWWKNSQQEGKG